MQDCNGKFNHLYFMNSFKTFPMQYFIQHSLHAEPYGQGSTSFLLLEFVLLQVL